MLFRSVVLILTKGLTVYKGLKEANVQIGDWIAISGAGGGLGHLGKLYPRFRLTFYISSFLA